MTFIQVVFKLIDHYTFLHRVALLNQDKSMPISKNQYSKEEIIKMSTTFVPAICTQCSGEMTVDPSLEKAFCQYCGTSFLVEKAINNYNVQQANIERVETVNIHHNHNQPGLLDSFFSFVEQQQVRKDEKKRLEEVKRKRDDKVTLIMLLILMPILILSFISLGANEEPSHDGEARTPGESSDFKGEDYRDVVSEFEENGFTNIETEKLDDLITGWVTKDGEVELVSVDGDVEYSTGWYPENVEVVITYHTFSGKEGDDVTEDEK